MSNSKPFSTKEWQQPPAWSCCSRTRTFLPTRPSRTPAVRPPTPLPMIITSQSVVSTLDCLNSAHRVVIRLWIERNEFILPWWCIVRMLRLHSSHWLLNLLSCFLFKDVKILVHQIIAQINYTHKKLAQLQKLFLRKKGNSVPGAVFSHMMPKMDFYYSHCFSWEKTH